jgi:hypothetical protein
LIRPAKALVVPVVPVVREKGPGFPPIPKPKYTDSQIAAELFRIGGDLNDCDLRAFLMIQLIEKLDMDLHPLGSQN